MNRMFLNLFGIYDLFLVLIIVNYLSLQVKKLANCNSILNLSVFDILNQPLNQNQF